jgi:WD40 repeat protein
MLYGWIPGNGNDTVIALSSAPLVTLTINSQYSRIAAQDSYGIIYMLKNPAFEKECEFQYDKAIPKKLLFTPDGATLISGTQSGRISQWDLRSRSIASTIPGNDNNVRCLSVSSRKNVAVSGSFDGGYRFWNLNNGEEITTWYRQSAYIENAEKVEYSNTGFHLLSITKANIIFKSESPLIATLWDLKTGCTIWSGPLPRGGIASAAFSANDSLLYLPGDSAICIYETFSGRFLKRFDIGAYIADFTISPTGTIYISSNNLITEYDAVTGLKLNAIKTQIAPASWACDWRNNRIAVGSNDDTVRFYDLQKHTLSLFWKITQPRPYDMAWSHDGRYLAVLEPKGIIQICDTKINLEHRTLHEGGDFTCMRFSKDDDLLITGSSDGKLRAWRTEERYRQTRLSVSNQAWCSAFNKNGTLLAVGTGLGVGGDEKDSVFIIDIQQQKTVARFGGPRLAIQAVSFCEDAKKIAAASADSTLRIWDIAANTLQHEVKLSFKPRIMIPATPDTFICIDDRTNYPSIVCVRNKTIATTPIRVYDCAFSRKYGTIVFAAHGEGCPQFSLTENKIIPDACNYGAEVNEIELCPDDSLLYCALSNGIIEKKEFGSGRILKCVTGSNPRLLTIGYYGNYLAYYDKNLVHVVDVRVMKEIAVFSCSRRLLFDLDFSPCSGLIVGSDQKSILSNWDIFPLCKILESIDTSSLSQVRTRMSHLLEYELHKDGPAARSYSPFQQFRIDSGSSKKTNTAAYARHADFLEAIMEDPCRSNAQ